jgi:uncharacterized protein YhbP (UPF0306 family)
MHASAPLSDSDRQAILALLAETAALSLATLDPDGAPRATPLFFAFDESLALTFLSDPASQHSRNLLAEPRCAVGLYPAVDDWRALRGLQMRGQARRLSVAESGEAFRLYARRFTFVADLPQAVDSASPYLFMPDWIRRIDNRQGFGFQREWDLHV